jgi:putative ABC transport system substrate-binding protein
MQLKRRDLTTLVGGAAAALPLTARAQHPERMRRIGVLSTGDDAEGQTRFATFAQALKQLGWSDDPQGPIRARDST